MQDNSDGTYLVQYTLHEVGPHRIEVTLAEAHLRTSPWHIAVVDAWQRTYTKGSPPVPSSAGVMWAVGVARLGCLGAKGGGEGPQPMLDHLSVLDAEYAAWSTSRLVQRVLLRRGHTSCFVGKYMAICGGEAAPDDPPVCLLEPVDPPPGRAPAPGAGSTPQWQLVQDFRILGGRPCAQRCHAAVCPMLDPDMAPDRGAILSTLVLVGGAHTAQDKLDVHLMKLDQRTAGNARWTKLELLHEDSKPLELPARCHAAVAATPEAIYIFGGLYTGAGGAPPDTPTDADVVRGLVVVDSIEAGGAAVGHLVEAIGPPARCEAQLAVHQGQLVLYGGWDPLDKDSCFQDVWSWHIEQQAWPAHFLSLHAPYLCVIIRRPTLLTGMALLLRIGSLAPTAPAQGVFSDGAHQASRR